MKLISGIILINLLTDQQKDKILDFIDKNSKLFKEFIIVGEKKFH